VSTNASVCSHCGWRFNVPLSAAGLVGKPGKPDVLGVSPYALMRHRTLVETLNQVGKPRLAETVAACVGADELRLVHAMLKANGNEHVADAVDASFPFTTGAALSVRLFTKARWTSSTSRGGCW
jgi:hypothetical protein